MFKCKWYCWYSFTLFIFASLFSGELRNLLLSCSLGSNSKSNSMRKITPVVTQTENIVTLSEKQIQVCDI